MREIKFRGLDIQGEWRYGNLSILLQKVGKVEKGTYISNRCGRPFAFQVQSKTIGQFTGLHDKKRTKEYPDGQEIYEGDIVKEKWCVDNFTVIFQHGCFLAHDGRGPFLILDDRHLDYEVIGNIYENKELLK